MNTLLTVSLPLLVLAGQTPEPEDVKAGWLGFGVFLILAAAVVFLGFSLRKHLGKVDFEEPTDESAPESDDSPGSQEPARGREGAPGRGEPASNGDRER
jgi:hypothetical protein